MQCYSICKISLVTHPAHLSTSCSVPMHFSILAHLPAEGRWHLHSLSAGSWPRVPCLCKTAGGSSPAVPVQTGLLAPSRQWGPASGCAGARPGIADSCERTGGSQHPKLCSTVEPLPDREIHRDRFQLSTKTG